MEASSLASDHRHAVAIF